jgi:hypothetical protein
MILVVEIERLGGGRSIKEYDAHYEGCVARDAARPFALPSDVLGSPIGWLG